MNQSRYQTFLCGIVYVPTILSRLDLTTLIHGIKKKEKKVFLFNTTLCYGNQALVTVACCHSLTFCVSECKKGP